MSFNDEAEKPDSVLNLVISIDGIFFAQKPVDSGLVVDTDKLGLIRTAKLSGNSVDIRKVKTSLASLSFQLLDIDGFMSSFLMSKDDNYLEKEVILYAGFITGSFDFSEYKKLATTKLKSVSKSSNSYSFTSLEVVSEIIAESYFNFSELDSDITDLSTSLLVRDASNFPSSGRILIDSEYIIYGGVSGDTLTGLVRGNLGSPAASHKDGATVSVVTLVEQNPIDLMLDTMQNELGIAASSINITSFTDIRDNLFPSTQVRFYLTGNSDTLSFFEEEILQSINCRLTSIEGIIGLAILDQTDFALAVPDINEETIQGTPNWAIGSDKVVNEVLVKWGYDEGSKKFIETTSFTDADSISKFGKKRTLTYSFKGVKTDLNGSIIVSNMGARLLARTKNTQSDIKVKTFFSNASLNVGDDVSLTHRFLPNQGGGLGMSDRRLEIMSKAFDLNSKRLEFKLQFTSFSNLRVGIIAPSPLIVSVIDQKTFEVPDGSQYLPGYFLKIFDDVANDYFPDAPIAIASIDGNIITMESDFSTVLTPAVRVKFPCYSESSDLQTSKYGYIAPNSGFFSDGTKAYEILF